MERRKIFNSFAGKLQGKQQNKAEAIRPPYYDETSDFSLCAECSGVCATVCEENIIAILPDKTPSLDFSKSGCTFCDECANVCEAGVLEVEKKSHVDVTIEIDKLKCMSWSKNICFSCKDPCLENAIAFHGMFYPEITTNCTSCGFCIKYCPTEAIIIKKRG